MLTFVSACIVGTPRESAAHSGHFFCLSEQRFRMFLDPFSKGASKCSNFILLHAQKSLLFSVFSTFLLYIAFAMRYTTRVSE